SPNSVVHQHS
ncbi:hypothetical protein CP8484711_1149B, partial [Chlamydia psittaci 84-8471/1]